MRELQDYFCTEMQTKKLIELGFDGDKHIVLAKTYYYISTPITGILRSQALDFFRDKGYEILQETTKSYICWHIIIKGDVKTHVDGDVIYHQAESALIDKLIELETEVRNGN